MNFDNGRGHKEDDVDWRITLSRVWELWTGFGLDVVFTDHKGQEFYDQKYFKTDL
jgi:hypothetical protein